jgi:hypothetical protein
LVDWVNIVSSLKVSRWDQVVWRIPEKLIKRAS